MIYQHHGLLWADRLFLEQPQPKKAMECPSFQCPRPRFPQVHQGRGQEEVDLSGTLKQYFAHGVELEKETETINQIKRVHMSVGEPDHEMIDVDRLDGANAMGQAFRERQPPVLQAEINTTIWGSLSNE